MSQILCACGQSVFIRKATLKESVKCPACGKVEELEESHDFEELGLKINDSVEFIRKRRIVSEDTVQIDTPADSETVQEPQLASDASGGMLSHGQDYVDAGRTFGQYKILAKIGSGGMGVVYRAYDSSLDRDVALKILGRHLSSRTDFIERFKREARAAARISHPNITHIYTIGKEQGFHFFAMELVRGQPLIELVRDRDALPYREALDIVIAVAEGLQAACSHNVVHRDIKPANLMITKTGHVKITDFGLAKAYMENTKATVTGMIMGTPLYMSPEQARGETCDLRSDIYSLGATLYFLLHGRPPFQGPNAISVIISHLTKEITFPPLSDRHYPVNLTRVISQMMEKAPADRYQDYDCLIEDLTRVREGKDLARPKSQRVFRLAPPARSDSDTMRASKLRIAQSNLKMGRTDKALHLLKELHKDGGELGLRAAFILVKYFERRSEVGKVRELLDEIRNNSPHSNDKVWAGWKLFQIREKAAERETRTSLQILNSLVDNPSEDLPPESLKPAIKVLERSLETRERAREILRLVYDREDRSH